MSETNSKRWLSWLLALSSAWMPIARAQPPEIPPSWISYAQRVGGQFQTRLEADDVAANQLHRFLENKASQTSGTEPSPAILIRAWIGLDGAVTKVDFDSLGDAKADGILRSLLCTQKMNEPPPPGMRQPLRVRLRMEPNPNQEGAAGGA